VAQLFSVPLGAWKPDLAKHGHDGLVTCENAYPIANGYEPIGGFEAVTPALADWTGGGAFIYKDGTSTLLAGANAGLYSYSGSAWTSELAITAGRWRFAQNRDLVVAVHGGAPVAYDLAAGTAGTLGGSPPDAAYVATANDFTVLAGDPADLTTITWSGFGNPEEWTPGVSQSGALTLPDGGRITGLAGGEVLLVFQRQAIHRFQYVGGDTVWQRDKISSEVGCIEPGSICQAGRMVFFLSERGFMMTDGSSVTPIGVEAVDRTYFALHRGATANVYAAVDPRHYLACWSMPGNPGRVWAYNWVLQRWTSIAVPLKAVFQAFTSNINSDAVDAVYPGGADAIDLPMDSPIFAGGDPRFYVVSPSGVVGTLTGPKLEAEFVTPLLELGQGRRIRPITARPVTDATSGVTLALDARQRLGDAEGVRLRSAIRASGVMPCRSNGKFFALGLTISAGATWTYVQAIELEAGLGGAR
jgi:hypothetical protein